jgi:hypothetical protein
MALFPSTWRPGKARAPAGCPSTSMLCSCPAELVRICDDAGTWR